MTIEEFEQAVEQNRPKLLRFVHSIASLSDEDAEDIVQTALLHCTDRRAEFDPKTASIYTWMCKGVRWALNNYFRTKARRIPTIEVDEIPEEAHPLGYVPVTDIDVSAVVDDLPKEAQIVIKLLYIYGFTQEEVSSLLNMGRRTVRYWHEQAVNMLKDRYHSELDKIE